jgi:hypothetical protein
MKKYPILKTNEYIPFEMMLEHERQCFENHGQSVQRLSERGGTDYIETYYILNDSEYKNHDNIDPEKLQHNARSIVHSMAYEWMLKNNKLDFKLN